MRAILLLAAMASLAALAGPASAQAAHGDGIHYPLPLDGRLIAPYSRDYQITMTRDGVERPMGTARDRVVETTVDGRPALLRIQTTELNGHVQVDSAIALWDGMVPVSLTVRNADRRVRLAFAGPRAWGTMDDSAGSRPMERGVDGVLYSTSIMEFVMGALPLVEGYTASFHVLDSFRAGMPAFRVGMTVTGTTEIDEPGGRKTPAWVVDATMGSQRARMYFDVATRQWLGVIMYAPGMEIRYRPL